MKTLSRLNMALSTKIGVVCLRDESYSTTCIQQQFASVVHTCMASSKAVQMRLCKILEYIGKQCNTKHVHNASLFGPQADFCFN